MSVRKSPKLTKTEARSSETCPDRILGGTVGSIKLKPGPKRAYLSDDWGMVFHYYVPAQIFPSPLACHGPVSDSNAFGICDTIRSVWQGSGGMKSVLVFCYKQCR